MTYVVAVASFWGCYRNESFMVVLLWLMHSYKQSTFLVILLNLEINVADTASPIVGELTWQKNNTFWVRLTLFCRSDKYLQIFATLSSFFEYNIILVESSSFSWRVSYILLCNLGHKTGHSACYHVQLNTIPCVPTRVRAGGVSPPLPEWCCLIFLYIVLRFLLHRIWSADWTRLAPHP